MPYNLPYSIIRNRVKELLCQVGLKEKADISFMKYSTGQQQRLSLARALLNDPHVLLMDEPTRSLDPIAASELRYLTKRKLIKEQGKTILWCTHNLSEAKDVCDRLAILHKGKVIASGNIDSMQSLINDESVYQFKIDNWHQERLRKIGISPISTCQNNGYIELELKASEENIPILLKCLVENGVKVYACKRKEMELEEIFEKLIYDDGQFYNINKTGHQPIDN